MHMFASYAIIGAFAGNYLRSNFFFFFFFFPIIRITFCPKSPEKVKMSVMYIGDKIMAVSDAGLIVLYISSFMYLFNCVKSLRRAYVAIGFKFFPYHYKPSYAINTKSHKNSQSPLYNPMNCYLLLSKY